MRITILILFLSSPAFASDPSTICDENSSCTHPMQQIVENYKKGNVDFSKFELSGFSGSCYYISPIYDSAHEHHGAFLFERNSSVLFATGIFSFFTAVDPYKDMNAVELKKWFVENQSTFTGTTETNDQVELEYMGERSDFHYWFRSNTEKNKLYVLGQQFAAGQNSDVFCDLNAR